MTWGFVVLRTLVPFMDKLNMHKQIREIYIFVELNVKLYRSHLILILNTLVKAIGQYIKHFFMYTLYHGSESRVSVELFCLPTTQTANVFSSNWPKLRDFGAVLAGLCVI